MRMSLQPASRNRGQAASSALPRTIILFLVCAVPVLSTIAKNSLYLPKSNTTHYINIAAKMKLADAPVVSEPQTLETLVALVFPKPEATAVWPRHIVETPPFPKVSLTVCLQHRSPPLVFA